jgi:predicted XRE-type DNA-binding protein
MMSESDDFEVVHGSGNVFRDLRLPDADTEQMKSALAAEILKAMREQGLTHAAAAERAEVQRADISRICKVDLDRFTIDRLVRIVNRLDRRVEVVVSAAQPRRAAKKVATKEAV